jgi:hypothetical protein
VPQLIHLGTRWIRDMLSCFLLLFTQVSWYLLTNRKGTSSVAVLQGRPSLLQPSCSACTAAVLRNITRSGVAGRVLDSFETRKDGDTLLRLRVLAIFKRYGCNCTARLAEPANNSAAASFADATLEI